MRILVATDAWHPQVNGVVRTLTMMADTARPLGAEVVFLTPQSFRTFAMPSYRDLRVALPRPAKIARLIADARPDSIHIATEGPIGLLVRRYCRKQRLSLHHEFPYPLSGICPRACADPGILDLAGAAPLPCAEPRRDGGDAGAGERVAHARVCECGAVAARRRHRAVPPARRRSLPAGAGLPVRRPRCGRKKSRGVSRSRSARHQGDRRRRTGARDAGAEISASRVPRRAARRGAGAGLCRRRRLRVSEQDRHLRPGAAGGAGQRPAGCRVSGDRAARRHRHGAGRGAGRGFAQRMPCGAGNFAASLRRFCRPTYLGGFDARFYREYGRYPRRQGRKAGRSNS